MSTIPRHLREVSRHRGARLGGLRRQLRELSRRRQGLPQAAPGERRISGVAGARHEGHRQEAGSMGRRNASRATCSATTLAMPRCVKAGHSSGADFDIGDQVPAGRRPLDIEIHRQPNRCDRQPVRECARAQGARPAARHRRGCRASRSAAAAPAAAAACARDAAHRRRQQPPRSRHACCHRRADSLTAAPAGIGAAHAGRTSRAAAPPPLPALPPAAAAAAGAGDRHGARCARCRKRRRASSAPLQGRVAQLLSDLLSRGVRTPVR